MTDADSEIEKGRSENFKTKFDVDLDLDNLRSLPKDEIPPIINGTITTSGMKQIDVQASKILDRLKAGNHGKYILFYQYMAQDPQRTLFKVNSFYVDVDNRGELVTMENFRAELAVFLQQAVVHEYGGNLRGMKEPLVKAQNLINSVAGLR